MVHIPTVKHKPLIHTAQYQGSLQPVLYPFRAKMLTFIFQYEFNFASQLHLLFYTVLFQVLSCLNMPQQHISSFVT